MGHNNKFYPDNKQIEMPRDAILAIAVGPHLPKCSTLTPVLVSAQFALATELPGRIVWIGNDDATLRHLAG